MVAVGAAIPDPQPPSPSPSQHLPLRQPANRAALSSAATASAAQTRKPKSKNVPSRYLSPSPSTSSSNSTATAASVTTTAAATTTSSSSSSRRFASPLLSRSTNSAPSPSPAQKRAQSVDRRRPGTVRSSPPVPNSGVGEVSTAAKLLITSTRSLSVSFQGEAFSLPISKAKKAATPERRRATPTLARDQSENSRPVDRCWPARTRQANSNANANSFCRSVDSARIIDEKRWLIGFGSGNLSKLLQQSMIEEGSDGRRTSFDGRLSLDLVKVGFLKGIPRAPDANSLNESSMNYDLTASDTDSVSSGSTNGMQDCGGISKPKNGPKGIAISARFWQETNSRLRRLQDPGSPLSMSPISRITGGTNKLSQSKKSSIDSPLNSSSTMGSPIRGATRPTSPSKMWASTVSSPSRGMQSPSRVSPNSGSLSGNSFGMPSILTFSMDVRRGKMGEDRVVDAHLLRLLYNRYLQWRFVNARSASTFAGQRLSAEKILWNAWVTTSELRHTVTLKRMKLLLLRQKLKLTAILKGQIAYLDEWFLLEKEHTSSFLGATEALRASTLRLPVVGKATGDVQNLKDAIGSAVDVMHAMASSICSLSSKVEEMNSLVLELVNVSAKERLSLDQCRTFLSGLAALQVKDCSLRTHILQLQRVRPPC